MSTQKAIGWQGMRPPSYPPSLTDTAFPEELPTVTPITPHFTRCADCYLGPDQRTAEHGPASGRGAAETNRCRDGCAPPDAGYRLLAWKSPEDTAPACFPDWPTCPSNSTDNETDGWPVQHSVNEGSGSVPGPCAPRRPGHMALLTTLSYGPTSAPAPEWTPHIWGQAEEPFHCLKPHVCPQEKSGTKVGCFELNHRLTVAPTCPWQGKFKGLLEAERRAAPVLSSEVRRRVEQQLPGQGQTPKPSPRTSPRGTGG